MKIWQDTAKVIVSRAEVEEFNLSWPGSTLRDRSYWFEFDRENGDLIDTDLPEQDDGPAAAALGQDAKEFAAEEGAIPDWSV